jgi:large-conductance mechanosensitive channel
MYGIIWIAFFEVLTALFLHLGNIIDDSVHVILGLALLGFAFYIYRHVRQTPCPERIKLITRTTWFLSIFQAVLGVALLVGTALSWGDIYAGVISFLHVGTALAIITQASSSATAFDMWEEKEFETVTAK